MTSIIRATIDRSRGSTFTVQRSLNLKNITVQMKLSKLNNIFEDNSVKIAYLFGSQKDVGVAYLSGQDINLDKISDLDIGVVFDSHPRDIYRTYGDLYSDLGEIFHSFNLDLVFLQETDPLFQYEAMQGHLIYADDEQFLDKYEERILKLASDLDFKKKKYQKEIFEAVKDGYFEITLR